MTKDRPETTLFMIESLDGKISTGDNELLDVDKDFPKINGVKEGLYQYYKLEQKTDLYSLNSGKVQAKVGINQKEENIEKTDVSFIIIDNKPHLNDVGVNYFIKRSKVFFLITTNKYHPAFERKEDNNIKILYYEEKIDFEDLFVRLKHEHGINRMTIQTGGILNSFFLRKRLIDHVSIVIAPVLIGGSNTPTLIDGESFHVPDDLINIKALKLVNCNVLENSYIHVYYDVINDFI